MKCVLVVLACFAVSACSGASLEASPCPRLFVYEDTTTFPDRWYGIITLLSDTDLTGTWIRIIFDKPILQLGNWFGEVVKRSPVDYLVKNPNFNLKAHTPKVIRFFVRYRQSSAPPKLVGFRLNARVLCPEDLVTTTPSTTTEHLFTSNEEAGESSTASVVPVQLVADDATLKPFISHQSQRKDDTCGVTRIPPQEKSPNQVAQLGEFPWHAALYYTKDITIAYLCGASLISLKHLLTVAHCVVKGSTQKAVSPDRLLVYLGKYYLKHWSQEGTQTRYVSSITPHPDYKPSSNRNDIAVIKLFNPAEFTDVVRPICLWDENISAKDGVVVGWGFDESGKIEEKLMHVVMNVQAEDVCNSSIPNYSGKFGSNKTYCANFLDDTIECVGDSGGGMAFRTGEETDSVWHLRGLVTVSVVLQQQLKCGPQQFVVFTDVSKYGDWIKETMLL